MSKLQKGILISIEGIDGSGKSTLARALQKQLEKKDLPVLLTYEPGDSPLGKHIRKILQERDFAVCGQAEFLLFAADRTQHFTEVIIPHLEKKYIVISDRMGDSSMAYQGYARGVNKEMIQKVNNWAMQNRKPDTTLYIQLSVASALQRLKNRKEAPTVFEKEKEDFTKNVIKGFEEIFKNRDNVITLDGEQSADMVAKEAYDKIMKYLSVDT